MNGPSVVSLQDFLSPKPQRVEPGPATAPELSEREVRRIANVQRVVLALVVTGLVFIPLMLAFHASRVAVLIIASAVPIFLLNYFIAERTRSHRLAGQLTIFEYMAVIVAAAYSMGGLQALASPWNIFAPLIATYLLGARFGVMCGGIVISEVAVFAWLEFHGHVFPSISSVSGAHAQTWLVSLSTVSGVAFGVVASGLFESTFRRALRERERALGTLRDGQANLTALIENTNDLVLSTDGELRIVTLNSAFASRFQTKERFPQVNEPVLDHIPLAQRDSWRLELERALNGERVFTEQAFGSHARRVTYDLSFNPIFGRGGEAVGVSVFARDISERKRAQSEHARVATALEAAGEAVLITDLDACVAYANPGFFRLTGVPPADAVQHPLESFLEPASAQALADVLRSGKAMEGFSGELTWNSADGGSVISEVTIAPVWGAEGDTVSYVVIARDIRERKRAEAELEQLQRRLRETSHQAGMAEVATAVLHNVGNVLNSINVSATVIGEKVRGSKLKSVRQLSELFKAHADKLGPFFTDDPRGKLIPAYLAQLATHFQSEQEALEAEVAAMLGNVEHVKNVINTQQSYARVTGVIERTPPVEIIEEALRMDAQSYGRHGIKLERCFDENVQVAMLERHKVLQILHNLFINAKQAICEHGPSSRALKVSLAKSDVGFRVRIQDSGVGIKPENRLRIFNHGFTTKKTGHGFGLHASANAAKEMGGSLTCESEGEGLGATFVLELPLRPPARVGEDLQAP